VVKNSNPVKMPLGNTVSINYKHSPQSVISTILSPLTIRVHFQASRILTKDQLIKIRRFITANTEGRH
jgi:hypothetical protein